MKSLSITPKEQGESTTQDPQRARQRGAGACDIRREEGRHRLHCRSFETKKRPERSRRGKASAVYDDGVEGSQQRGVQKRFGASCGDANQRDLFSACRNARRW